MKDRHGAHICIISRDCPELLDKTINTTYSVFSKIRSYIYVSNVSTFDPVVIKKKFPSNIKTQFIHPKWNTDKSTLLNQLFLKLKSVAIYNIVLIWEGEVVLGETNQEGWSPSVASHLRVGTNTGNYWEIRKFNLLNNWYFKDPYALIPSLEVETRNGIVISRETGDYVLVDLTLKREEYPLFFKNPFYIYKKACELLLRGEITLAKKYFEMRCQNTAGDEILARSYLGIAICHKINKDSWSDISKNIEYSLIADRLNSLEAIYFLLTWSIELGKELEAYNLICRYKNKDLFAVEPSLNGLLTYESRLYEYAVLYLFTKCCYVINRYKIVKKTSDILLIRDDIPTDVKQDLIHMNNYANEILNSNEINREAFNKPLNIAKENITLEISKINKVKIVNDTKASSEFNNSIYYSNFMKSNNKFSNISGFCFSDELKHPNFFLTIKKRYFWCEVSLSDKEKQIIPLTSQFSCNKLDNITDILKSTRFPYKTGLLILDKISGENQIPSKYFDIKFNEINLELSKYHTIYYRGGDRVIIDIMVLLVLQLMGCHTIYNGNKLSYQIVSEFFPDTISNVSGWKLEYLQDYLSKHTSNNNSRKQYSNAYQLLFPFSLTKLITNINKNKTKNPFRYIVNIKGTICSSIGHPYNLVKVDQISEILERPVDDWILLNNQSNISLYQYKLANILYNYLKKNPYLDIDVLIIPELTDDTCLANLKISLGSNYWEFIKVESFITKSVFMIKSTDLLKGNEIENLDINLLTIKKPILV